MADNTKIEWCDASWPVIRGCTKCSPGCDNCWAISDAHLHAGSPNAKAAAHFAGLTQIQNGRPNWTGEVRLDESILELPLKWKKPRKIFVASSGDLFHDRLAMSDIAFVLGVMRSAPQHEYLILTKRAERMASVLTQYGCPGNWWPGVSVEDDERARLRVPSLLKILGGGPHWVSYEPALGPVNWNQPGPWDTWLSPCGYYCDHDEFGGGHRPVRGIEWVVIGGESGRGARPFDLAWARDTIAQCRAARVPVFMKQMGRRIVDEYAEMFPYPKGYWVDKNGHYGGPVLHTLKGSEPSEWPEWARVREWPRERGAGGK